jgi:hypothetical protein
VELQLSNNILCRDLSLIQEKSPSLINITFRPEETSPNYTAAKLSEESSLTKQVKLPDNKCSKRHAFRKVSLMLKELSPPVNFLKKLTLQKKK